MQSKNVSHRRRAPRLLQGTVDLLILRTLSQGPCHGYGISASIRRCSEGELGLEDAALYQALHRLERRGAIESEWGQTESNRRAKYYQLTARGRRQLAAESDSFKRYAAAVFRVLEGP